MLPIDILAGILEAVPVAVEVADNRGNILYVNKAFTKVTGIPAEQRLHKNIFNVSPDGALALALRKRKRVSGHRCIVGGTMVEVISNASPITVDGKMLGAVVVFQHITDIINLLEELRRSNNIIKNLSHKFGQVTRSKYSFSDIIGCSEELNKVLTVARNAAASNSTVLLLGESGTGKELFAHAIHNASARKNGPFIKVNCAAVPENLLESEFFGHQKGAFTGAINDKIGRFELANGGTIFLDEIGDISLVLQAKLLRVLQEMEFERVGGIETINVDMRVIAATNRDLRQLVRTGRFREDLFYRLNVIEINIPPLRERKDDIEMIAGSIIEKLNRKMGTQIKGLSADAVEALSGYHWPGNVRELENVLERVSIGFNGSYITADAVKPHLNGFSSAAESMEIMEISKMEEILIKRALEKYGTSMKGKKKAAAVLNISLATLYNKIKKYNL
ncbi:PAS domain S-box-containing protein [Desulfohalotomaculum tongense]|uniref:sigma-54 interaction domain-containing protein n=1 Tax=Desulforadius tongensis TaxID=1216062 RepID=UPI0019563342|nr:sigma 54-interacting transcriptional regulator [Desulforadius tongensis]MBM7854130.1 PAS domain S-box-containing protein [Desulforadius tongensis]